MDIKAIRKRINIVNRYKNLKENNFSDEQASTILSFMFELTPDGFEQYVRDYFNMVGHFDKIIVTGGINDKGIDIKGKIGNNYIAIQCKKFITSHVTEKDVLMFIEQTKDIKARLGNAISFYFITTNWVNRQAWARATNNGVHILYSRDILKMNEKLDIEDFLKNNKKNPKIVTGVDIYKVLDVYYYRKALGSILGDIVYFINKYIVSKFSSWYINYEKVEEAYPEKEANQKLLEKTPLFDKKLSYN